MLHDDDVELLSDYLKKAELPKPKKGSTRFVSDDHVGIEVELERAEEVVAPVNWVAKADGSLRNGGVEFLFRRPLGGEELEHAIDDFYVACEKSPTTPSKSIRTSVHVHVNMLDTDADTLSKFLLLYSIFEQPLFKTFAPTRINNHFCTPYTSCLDFLAAPRWLRDGFQAFFNRMDNPAIGRYSALNIKSLSKFGTLEFRHLAGTWDKTLMTDWVNVILALKRAAQQPINFREVYFSNSQNGYEMQLRQIFPPEVVDRVFNYYKAHPEESYNLDVIQGIRFAQNSLTPKIRFA